MFHVYSFQVNLPDSHYKMKHISWKVAGVVWAYNLLWFLVQDIFKVMCYRMFDHFHITKEIDLVAKAAHNDIHNIEIEFHDTRLNNLGEQESCTQKEPTT